MRTTPVSASETVSDMADSIPSTCNSAISGSSARGLGLPFKRIGLSLVGSPKEEVHPSGSVG